MISKSVACLIIFCAYSCWTASAASSRREVYRINCGGLAFIDSYGRDWEADAIQTNYSKSGIPVVASPEGITNLAETLQNLRGIALYESARLFSSSFQENSSNPGYSFPVNPNRRYLLKLHFAALSLNGTLNNVYKATFGLKVNNLTLYYNFSVYLSAGAVNTPVIREFLLPFLDSPTLNLTFVPSVDYSFVNGIELTDTNPNGSSSPTNEGPYGSLLSPYLALEAVRRINCGGGSVGPTKDALGRVWDADDFYSYSFSSYVLSTNASIDNTAEAPDWLPEVVYQSERVGAVGTTNGSGYPIAELSYEFPVEPNTDYLVRLHFAELQPNISSTSFSSSSIIHRSFDVLLNNVPLLLSFDVAQTTNSLFSATFYDALVSTGEWEKLSLNLATSPVGSPVVGPSISGIEALRVVNVTEVEQLEGFAFGDPISGPSPREAPDGKVSSVSDDLLAIRAAWGNPTILQSWANDSEPCLSSYEWKGIGCSNGTVTSLILPHLGLSGILDSKIERLVDLEDLWLFGNDLYGPIPSQIGNLTSLRSLRLHNNSFTGSIPDTLGNLQNLQEITLEENFLSGPIPSSLLNLSSLSSGDGNEPMFSYVPGNTGLCAPTINSSITTSLPYCGAPLSPPPALLRSPPPPPLPEGKDSTVVAAIVGSLGGALLLAICILVGYFIGTLKRSQRIGDGQSGEELEELGGRSPGEEDGNVKDANEKPFSKQVSNVGFSAGQIFSLAELRSATDNFSDELVIGSGGFGKVYKGTLPPANYVAIKRHVAGCGQGSQQFLQELSVLSKVRHRHLVPLVGYCREEDEMILVYEYMPGGTLREALEGQVAGFGWARRLQLAIEAAKGIDYLHAGLSPAVIHRDVKSTNILLDSRASARVADFGLSRSGPHLGESHVSTAVRGSFGYVDPAYYKWLKLSPASDVYSFGVVLLELMAGRKVIDLALPYDTNQVNLVEWARPLIQSGMISSFVDKRLERDGFRKESMEHVGSLVLSCLQEPGNLRPSMDVVVRELEFALELERNPLLQTVPFRATPTGFAVALEPPSPGFGDPLLEASGDRHTMGSQSVEGSFVPHSSGYSFPESSRNSLSLEVEVEGSSFAADDARFGSHS